MERWKWLCPGIRVKRWFALMLLGLVVSGMGLLVLAAEVRPFYVQFELFLEGDRLLLGSLMMIGGFGSLALGVRGVIRSVVGAVYADPDRLADAVYRHRGLTKGIRIAVIGGGTGLAVLLRGLKKHTNNITAVVTVADDGGSSGRIRDELGILPPGDIRSTLIALADTEPLMESLFQYRFPWGKGLEGHSFGNLFIAAMTDLTGDFEEAIRQFSRVLAVRGTVLPATLDTVNLRAVFHDGSVVVGESGIPQQHKTIDTIELLPPDAAALPDAVSAIRAADLVVIGPGSLYTSIIPNLLISGIRDALADTEALRIYVCNAMTQPGETDRMTASEHARALVKHCGGRQVMDLALLNDTRILPSQLEAYAQKGAHPVDVDSLGFQKLGIPIVRRDLLDEADLVRHDSAKIAAELLALAGSHRMSRE